MELKKLYQEKKDTRIKLNSLYESEAVWRSLLHDGVRNATRHRSGKLQRVKNKILSEINHLKIRRKEIEFEIKRIDGCVHKSNGKNNE